MSHLTDLAAEVTAALDQFAEGDLDAGYRAASCAHALRTEATRIETALGDQLAAVERARVYGADPHRSQP